MWPFKKKPEYKEPEYKEPHPLPSSYDAEEEAVTIGMLWEQKILPPHIMVERCDLHFRRFPATVHSVFNHYFGMGYDIPNPTHSALSEQMLRRLRADAALQAAKLDLKAARKIVSTLSA